MEVSLADLFQPPSMTLGGMVPPPQTLDKLVPQRYYGQTPEWWDRGVQSVAKGVGNLAALPGRAMQQGITTEEAIPWAANVGLGMVGTPGTPAGALGSGMKNLYHGSPSRELGVLNPSNRGPFGSAVYATPAPQVAERYAGAGGQVYELPRQYDVFQGLGARDNVAYSEWKSDKARLIAAAEPDKKAALAKLVENSSPSDGYPLIARIQHLYGSKESAQDLFKRAGFEGVSGHVDGPEVALFGAQSVKP